jgi:hypothetical protein
VFDTKKEIISKHIRNREMMLWLYEKLGICPSEMRWAYEAGDLEAIKWAAENCGIYPMEENISTATWREHFHIITWIYENVYPKDPSCFSVAILQSAIGTGNLEIAEYLVQNVFPESKTRISTSWSVDTNNRLLIHQWAHKRGFTIDDPESEMTKAVLNEDRQNFEWLFDNFPANEPDSQKWELLVRFDRHKFYKWFLEKYPWMRKQHELVVDAHKAHRTGSLRILKILYEKDPSLHQLISHFKKDVTRKNYHLYQWLAANGYPV